MESCIFGEIFGRYTYKYDRAFDNRGRKGQFLERIGFYLFLDSHIKHRQHENNLRLGNVGQKSANINNFEFNLWHKVLGDGLFSPIFRNEVI